ncbi:M20 family metallo-hydrolase [Marinobacter sp. M3C]|jgi:N-carbamoyl-L-amino-acid hydrolase|uniref:M20 family metallo-hydrolase n=1 Tax=Marinobacter sp. M3C TaxID=2917715 RepID=UPI002010AB94|nr:M20 family metallo-hydrolase [Marinobacter sp. M3C]UQG60847.1 M20 family metallo-hydrolase [Marinobacter sp. M3C]
MNDSRRLGDCLDGQRFWEDVQSLASIGALHPKGIRRLALDAQDNQARLWLAEQGRALGCEAYYDDLGNVFIRRAGKDSSRAPFLIGSHLDSQPQAGIHDGALGVVAGLAVLRTLHDQGIDHLHPLEVVAWTNEEGARFVPGASGSSWFAGQRDYHEIASSLDDSSIRFSDALADCLDLLKEHGLTYRPKPFTPHAFLELHIEQGPVLETLGKPVGVVSGIQGVNWYEIEVKGQANHAGTTPLQARRDAFDSAHDLVSALKAAVFDQDDDLRFTIGKFSVWPDSVNTIAQRATFTIDLRHPSQTVLDALDARFHDLTKCQWGGCDVTLKVTSRVAPVAFPDSLLDVLHECARHYCPDTPELVSGAFHDAIHLAHVCPTAMLFTPCRQGLSHHPDEHIEREDAEVAARVLTDAATSLLG